MENDPEQAIEHDADDLDQRIEDLGEHIDEAKDLLADQADDDDPVGEHEVPDEPSEGQRP